MTVGGSVNAYSMNLSENTTERTMVVLNLCTVQTMFILINYCSVEKSQTLLVVNNFWA